MAKRQNRNIAEVEAAPAQGGDGKGKAALSAGVRKMVDALKRPFRAFVEGYAKIAVRREEIAPQFMKAYEAWRKETGQSFVNFCRLLDPSIPQQSRTVDGVKGYRDHRSYQAGDYLRRLNNRNTAQGSGTTQPARSNSQAMARLLSSFAQISKHPEAFWLKIGAELGLTNKQISNLQKTAAATKPLIQLDVKPMDLKIVHIEPEKGTATVEKAA